MQNLTHGLYEGFSEEQPVFVGRRAELQILEEHFKSGTRVIIIHGVAGSGKTTLARCFITRAQKIFPAGVLYKTAFRREDITPLIYEYYHHAKQILTKEALLIIDAADSLSDKDIVDIREMLRHTPKLSLLLIARETKRIMPKQFSLALRGLDHSDFMSLLLFRAAAAHDMGYNIRNQFYKEAVDSLRDKVSGSPIYADIAGNLIREGLLDWNQLLKAFGDFQCPGIVGPDGKPIAQNIQAPESIIIDVKKTNAELLQKLKKTPDLLRSLTPRKFEEIVAEILKHMGYEITLTPSTRDGGFDMYAATRENIGSFLYLVECKKYTPPTKVGVQVVRALHGVVELKNANAGIIVTTSFFTKEAKAVQQECKYKIQFKDYIELEKWLGNI